MARDYAAIYTNVWSDPDWRSLTPRLQHGYWLLLTQPRLSPCGVLDFIPGRYANLAAGMNRNAIERLVDDLRHTKPRPYVVMDDDTCELLLRSFVRWDGLMAGPKSSKAVAKDFAAIESDLIRQAVIDELRALHQERPKSPGWTGIREQDPILMDLVEAPERPILKAVG